MPEITTVAGGERPSTEERKIAYRSGMYDDRYTFESRDARDMRLMTTLYPAYPFEQYQFGDVTRC
ncbi:hypothetical protein [Haloarcula nitratireducens]|uniref:Uncharacterized protein n=1 Tax=Haloarcula nitratireducens TaxID=2487749 RepID=A0AAW4PJ79_9EURY|nr:hypothetical protein [Halomicroarcula nitratireducens]MBX0297618.1 hypothetical protein [Halomicroarcula nitratireducens]